MVGRPRLRAPRRSRAQHPRSCEKALIKPARSAVILKLSYWAAKPLERVFANGTVDDFRGGCVGRHGWNAQSAPVIAVSSFVLEASCSQRSCRQLFRHAPKFAPAAGSLAPLSVAAAAPKASAGRRAPAASGPTCRRGPQAGSRHGSRGRCEQSARGDGRCQGGVCACPGGQVAAWFVRAAAVARRLGWRSWLWSIVMNECE